MATDPVEAITVEEYDSGFTTNLGASLREMARLEPSLETPYLTAYLDWRPEGQRPHQRNARIVFEHESARLRDRYDGDSAAWKSLNADIERVWDFLDEDLDPAVHGVIIIANSGRGIFETFVLALPVETRITAGPTPALLPMTRIVEDYPRYAVLLADQNDAILSVINRANRYASVAIRGTEGPRRHKQGGWSQRRFQMRHEERVAHFARAVAEETRKALHEGDLTMLVVGAGEVMMSALNAEFHDEVKKRIVGEISLDTHASRDEIIEASMPVIEQAEREREFNTVTELLDKAGAGGLGVLGVEPTLDALVRGQVMMLVTASDFSAPGWADYTMDVYGVGPVPDEHPAGGDLTNIYPVELAEEMVRLTVATDAHGEIIHPGGAAAAKLGDHKVGAILRFPAG